MKENEIVILRKLSNIIHEKKHIRASSCCLLLSICFIISGLCTSLYGEKREITVFYRGEKGSIERDISKYEVQEKDFGVKDLSNGFVEAAKSTKLLYFGKYAIPDEVFSKPEYCAAVKKMLENGGTIFFDYIASPQPNSSSWKFFKELNVEIPERDQALKEYTAVPFPASNAEILNIPNKITGTVGAYGGWRDSKDFDVILKNKNDAQISTMLMKKSVAGKGTVILNQAMGIFSLKHANETGEKLMANILAYAFGSIPASPGRLEPIRDAYLFKQNIPNKLYMKAADKLYWHSETSSFRIPVLVGETIGMKRSAPVTVKFKLPENTDVNSLALYTHWGEREPFQVVSCEKDIAEVVFESELEAYETRLFLLYCGNKKVENLKSNPGFIVSLEDNGWLLRNDWLEVVLRKEHPVIGILKPVGTKTKNELATWAAYDLGTANGGDWANGAFKAEITANGPVMKQVVFKNEKLKVSYTLYSKSKSIFCKIEKIGDKNLSTVAETYSGWAPMGDGIHDSLVYETPEGIKELDLNYSNYSVKEFLPYLKEGWLAFSDSNGETGGEFFDLQETKSVKISSHFCNGYASKVNLSSKSAIYKGYTAQKGSWGDLRDLYIAWKNPAVVELGNVIDHANAIPPHVAEFGKDFIKVIGKAHWYNSSFGSKDFNEQIEKLLLITGRLGGNYVKSSGHRIEFNKILIPAARKIGFGVDLEISGSAVPKEREKSIKEIEDAAAQGCNMIHFMDEYWFKGNDEVCKNTFKEKYKMEMPDNWSEEKLSQPPYYNYIFYKMDAIAETARAMSNALKKKSPATKCYIVTSPVNHINLYKYHDLESFSDALMSTCSDVYTTRYDYAKYIIKQMRGAQGNDRPYFSVNGCLDNANDTTINAYMHVMLGANGMWHWVLSDFRMNPAINYANARVFNWLGLTDAGEIFGKARPFKYLAVLRDRDAFIDAIKSGDLNAGQQRIQDICRITNVPLNILYSKHIQTENLNSYAVLIIPSNKVLSDNNAKIIDDYVKKGGTVIVEGLTLQNKIISDLCGISPASETLEKVTSVKGTENPFKELELSSPLYCVPVKTNSQDIKILAKQKDNGVVFERNAGKGKVIYVSLTNMPLDWTKRLAIYAGGKRPLEVSEGLETEIDTNILTDGKRYIVALHNLNGIKKVSGEIKINLNLPQATTLTDLFSGEQKKDWGKYSIILNPNGFSFVLLDTEGKYNLTDCIAVPQIETLPYSKNDGMKFLYLNPVKKQNAEIRKKEKGKIYVAVFKNAAPPKKGPDFGREAIMKTLIKFGDLNIVPEFISDAKPETLEFYDVVIFPNMQYRASNLSEDWEKNVRNYVEQGGNVMLINHCAGYASAANAIFPEVGTVAKIVSLKEMEAVEDHSIITGKSLRDRFPDKVKDPAFNVYVESTKMKKGEKFQTGFPDYMEINPGKSGTVIVKSVMNGEQGGTPAVVAGKSGKGRVLLSGMDIGANLTKENDKWRIEEATTPGEDAILINSIFWLTEKTNE
ncbi:MAG: hypothetical protein A2017_09025 [Lentisphaerae bacterium GWF2_44_16]|nr:MAG: hypothetical protein A2017_09025 [Lentisphaerae bacterium GWF2_44_16]